MYIWQREDWHQFRWNKDYVNVRLSSVRYAQGRLAGKLVALGFHVSSNAMLNAMADDVVADWRFTPENFLRKFSGFFLFDSEIFFIFAKSFNVNG